MRKKSLTFFSISILLTTLCHTAVDCSDAAWLREKLGKQLRPDGSKFPQAPSFIRFIFHDAIDYLNTVSWNGEETGYPGGVDACLHNPIDEEKSEREPVNSHNRNLPNGIVDGIMNSMNSKLGDHGISEPDVYALGAVVVLEVNNAITIPEFRFGRKKGDCGHYHSGVNCCHPTGMTRAYECASGKHDSEMQPVATYDVLGHELCAEMCYKNRFNENDNACKAFEYRYISADGEPNCMLFGEVKGILDENQTIFIESGDGYKISGTEEKYDIHCKDTDGGHCEILRNHGEKYVLKTDGRHFCGFTDSLENEDICECDIYIQDAPGKDFDGDHHREMFQALGFSPKEQAALMGAHTFGKIQVCAGGFGGIEKGDFCDDPNKLFPSVPNDLLIFTESEYEDLYHQLYASNDVYAPSYWDCRNSSSSDDNSGCQPLAFNQDIEELVREFSDGSFFDATPTTFDNNYYQNLMDIEQNYGGFDTVTHICCGQPNEESTQCKRDGGPITDRLSNPLDSQNWCDYAWCVDEHNGKNNLKSVRSWVKADPKFVKHPEKFGTTRRNALLGGDVSLLGHEETKHWVEYFSQNEDEFKNEFAKVFAPLIERGFPDEAMNTCHPSSCTWNSKNQKFICKGARDYAKKINFKLDEFDCNIPTPNEQTCEVIGGVGMAGILSCTNEDGSNELFACCANNPCPDYNSFFDKNIVPVGTSKLNVSDASSMKSNGVGRFVLVELVVISSVFIFFTLAYSTWSTRNKIDLVYQSLLETE